MPLAYFRDFCRSFSKRRQRPARPRLALESLEDRSLLSSTGLSPLEISSVVVKQAVVEEVASSRTTAVAGIEFAGVVAEFPASYASRMHASIDWGDGTQSPGSVVLTNQGDFSVLGRHTYSISGSYVLTITVTLEQDAVPGAGSQTGQNLMYVASLDFHGGEFA